jgi:hypothetical protein
MAMCREWRARICGHDPRFILCGTFADRAPRQDGNFRRELDDAGRGAVRESPDSRAELEFGAAVEFDADDQRVFISAELAGTCSERNCAAAESGFTGEAHERSGTERTINCTQRSAISGKHDSIRANHILAYAEHEFAPAKRAVDGTEYSASFG